MWLPQKILEQLVQIFLTACSEEKMVGTNFIAVVTLTDNFTKVTTAAQWCGG